MSCSFCGDGSVFYARTHEGVSLCSKCFTRSIEDKVRRTIARYKMLLHNDRVAIGVSGGKDSLALLIILKKLMKRFPLAGLVAITVDEGIHGYRDEALKISGRFCETLGVEQRIVSYQELFGISMDELVKRKGPMLPCSYCGVLRRRAINLAARYVRATKIATAHNLDDEVQTVFLNLLHGNFTRLAFNSPYLEDSCGRFLPRIKPLCEIPEREVVLYGYLSGIEFQTVTCPYGREALREDVRNMVNLIEAKHAGVKFAAFRSAEKLRSILAERFPSHGVQSCSSCGEPSSAELCEVCKTLGNSPRPQVFPQSTL